MYDKIKIWRDFTRSLINLKATKNVTVADYYNFLRTNEYILYNCKCEVTCFATVISLKRLRLFGKAYTTPTVYPAEE